MQHFFINKGSILPILELKLIDNGRVGSTAHVPFYEALQNADIYFTMTDVDTGVCKVAHQPGVLIEADGCSDQFNIGYEWKPRDVSRVGRYRGQFEIIFGDDNMIEFSGKNLIVPIQNQLIINVTEGIIKK
jgi:hypothetical protein